MIPLAAFEEVTGASGMAPRIEAMLPAGARVRQLSVRTLLSGMCLAQADGRPAHLTRVRQALAGLPGDDQRRLGVTADWKRGPHQLTYRQAECTFGLVARALRKDEPDGRPSPELQAVCDGLLEASVPEQFKHASSSLAGPRLRVQARRGLYAALMKAAIGPFTGCVTARAARRYDDPMEVSIPASAQPVLPQPERTPVAVRAAIARLDSAALARFEEDWAATMTRAREEYSVLPVRHLVEHWWLWVAVTRWPTLAARLRECEQIVAQSSDRATRRAASAEIGAILETAAQAA